MNNNTPVTDKKIVDCRAWCCHQAPLRWKLNLKYSLRHALGENSKRGKKSNQSNTIEPLLARGCAS